MSNLPANTTNVLAVSNEPFKQAALFQCMKLESNVSMQLSIQAMQALYNYTACYESDVLADSTDTAGLMTKRMMTKLKRRVGKRMQVIRKKYSISLPSEEATAFCEALKVLKGDGIYEQTTFNHLRDLILKFYA